MEKIIYTSGDEYSHFKETKSIAEISEDEIP